ncbi:hypothetical protein BDW74DRAFT_180657 [Aspergillus multicolor]|uniref:uncharacterized protein n=1 Tax=Aspergillus multicolor TaxID=41759 RepID=UPI003CCE1D9B
MSQPTAGSEVAAQVAQRLDEAKIPNLLWGWCAIALIRDDMGFPEPEFVVHDSMIKSATEILINAGFPLCTDTDCIELCADRMKHRVEAKWVWARNAQHIVGDAHFHLKGANPNPEKQPITHLHYNGEDHLPVRKRQRGGIVGTDVIVTLVPQSKSSGGFPNSPLARRPPMILI